MSRLKRLKSKSKKEENFLIQKGSSEGASWKGAGEPLFIIEGACQGFIPLAMWDENKEGFPPPYFRNIKPF